MDICRIWRLLACTMLMVMLMLLSNVHGQPVKISSSSSAATDGVVVKLVIQLTRIIDDRFNRMQEMISSMNNPSITDNCTVHLASFSYNDSKKDVYVRTSGGSSNELLGLDELGSHRIQERGVTIFDLDPKTCTTRNRQTFDTFESPLESMQLFEALESATAGRIVVGVTANTAEREDNVSFKNVVGSFFARYNMNIVGVGHRYKFAFIMQKGYPKKTVFQMKRPGGKSLKMRITVHGSSIHDLTFSRV